jgi:lipopolysaccharide transport system ATP-binding protein
MSSKEQRGYFLIMRSSSDEKFSMPASQEDESKPAVILRGIRKEYRLYDSLADQAIDVLGLSPLRFWRSPTYRNFMALDGIDLDISQGERVGIVGRNGAGKTTLLKLITGNFAPSDGHIELNGDIQAIMKTGLGFHGEFSGYENIKSSLIYNGLEGKELESAIQDIIEFCELGDFIDQPVKIYSLGMRTRLQFAAATAIKPDILIIDEVLGAGDAYFAGKSAARMKRLTMSGCTLLLVSHSIQQILQFCERAVWIERGKILMDDEALKVIRTYENFAKKLEYEEKDRRQQGLSSGVLNDMAFQNQLIKSTLSQTNKNRDINPEISTEGLDRWQGEGGLKIDKIRMLNKTGIVTRIIEVGHPAEIEFTVSAEKNGAYPVICVLVIYSIEDKLITRHISEKSILKVKKGEEVIFKIRFDEVLFGPGHYYFSSAIYSKLNMENQSDAAYYDLLNRAIEFEVSAEDHTFIDLVKQPGSWDVRYG